MKESVGLLGTGRAQYIQLIHYELLSINALNGSVDVVENETSKCVFNDRHLSLGRKKCIGEQAKKGEGKKFLNPPLPFHFSRARLKTNTIPFFDYNPFLRRFHIMFPAIASFQSINWAEGKKTRRIKNRPLEKGFACICIRIR